MTVRLLIGDCRERLAELEAGSVHCCVTSPPYFGLRDYGTGQWAQGDDSCDHVAGAKRYGSKSETAAGQIRGGPFRDECGKCGAIRIDRQMGLEATPDEFVAGMVAVFAEVRRVLRDDGTLWLNIGDSYAAGKTGRSDSFDGRSIDGKPVTSKQIDAPSQRPVPFGLKPKDLVGIPWLLAFALRADGWYLRQDIIWSKPNPMPESVRDRCTKSHEYLFLLSKSPRYYFDAEAIAEPSVWAADVRNGAGRLTYDGKRQGADGTGNEAFVTISDTRNKRSVWEVTTQPFSEAHFATFPPDLIEPCILAGCPESVCSACGAPWERTIMATAPDGRTAILKDGRSGVGEDGKPLIGDNMTHHGQKGSFTASRGVLKRETIGWAPTCACNAPKARGTVLDPFGGAGTTGLVADRLQRNAILIELNPAYAEMARRRIDNDRGGLLDAMEAA